MEMSKEGKDYKKKYDQYKSIVINWEQAFSREKGQQPGKSDFIIAPRSVHVAYFKYLQIKRLLSKLGTDGDLVGLGLNQTFKKPKPIETPVKIFQKRDLPSDQERLRPGCIDEYDPTLEKSLQSTNPSLATPSASSRAIVSQRMLAALPGLKFVFRTPSKPKATLDATVPFGKLDSKLLRDSDSSITKSGTIPRGKFEPQVEPREGISISSTLDSETFEFSTEIGSILEDVRKSVENYDVDEFEDESLVDVEPGLRLGNGLGTLNLGVPELPLTPYVIPVVLTTCHDKRLEIPKSAELIDNLHSEKTFLKARVTNPEWIDRCRNGEDPETLGDCDIPPAQLSCQDQLSSPRLENILVPTTTTTAVSLDRKRLRVRPSPSPPSLSTRVSRSASRKAILTVETEKTATKSKKSSTTGNTGKGKKVTGPRPSTTNRNPEKVPAVKRKAAEMSEYDFFDDSPADDDSTKKGKKHKKRPRIMRLKKPDENFVRIDLTKKVFVRGKKKMTGIMNKRENWKMKKRQIATENRIKLLKCKKCGEIGHFAKFCMKTLQDDAGKSEEIDHSPFPSLEEAARMIWSKKAAAAATATNRTNVYGSKPIDHQVTTSGPTNIDQDEVEPTLILVDQVIENSNPTEVESEQTEFSESQLNLGESSGFDLSFGPNGEGDGNNDEVNPIRPVITNPNDDDPLTKHDSQLIDSALSLFGYKDFRPGQKAGITRVLRGQSTLVVLSTGTGKSLCYLLPAYIYAQRYPGSLTICVSPLVSLMEDQVQSIPPFLAGACLHTNMTTKQRDLVLDKVRQKKIQVLLVSPEAVCGGIFGLLRNVQEFPPVSFACIDEVHCVSEWSHNFRPSYLRVCQILRERLHVQTILGLTATATSSTIGGICSQLAIDPKTVIRGEIVPNNLRLSCSRDLNREEGLITLLKSKRLEGCDSIIIYCTRREQCDKIATLIRTTFTVETSYGLIKEGSRRRISTECETYHAGMSAARRKSVQNNFMTGKIRIVVATVAFGMGIDKADIRAVIHYNMPKTFESYIQEIGRAGRDGLPAECHLFLDNNKGQDICELKRHIYSNSVERTSLRKLLSRIFKQCTCRKLEKIRNLTNTGTGTVPTMDRGEEETPPKSCSGHEVSFSVDTTTKELDIADENIETILCYLEHYEEQKVIQILPKCYHLCSIQSYGGTNLLKASARNCPALAAAIAMESDRKSFKEGDVHLEFNFVEVANTLGWSSTQMRKELKRLEWAGTQFDDEGTAIRFRKSGILVQFSDLAYRIQTHGTLSNQDSDSVLNYLHGRNQEQERMELFQLYRIYDCLLSNSCTTVDSLCESYDPTKSDRLKGLILEYFNRTETGVPTDWKPPISGNNQVKEEQIRQDVRKLIQNHGDQEFSSRAIGRIFQGIPSPRFPAEDWFRNRAFWRKHLDVDFYYLAQLAAEELY